MKKLRVIILIFVLVGFLLSATLVGADTADPSPDPSLEDVYIYKNVLETGDWFMSWYANIPYGTPPSTPITQTFIWQLIDIDGITELGNTIGFAYNNDGYGYNVYSMYWSAAEVTALGMVWNTTYTLRLSGNPAVFVTPPTYNFTINIGDYSTLTDTDEVKLAIADMVILLATDLDNKWGLTPTYSLLTQAEAGTVLSIYGETVFRGVIYGVQAMAPTAFNVIIQAITVPDRTWTDNYSVNLTNQWSGTWVDTAQAAGKVLFGTDYDLLSIIVLLILCGGLMYADVRISGDHWAGFIDIAVVAIMGARLGMYDLAFLILVVAGCWFYIGTKVWFGMIK